MFVAHGRTALGPRAQRVNTMIVLEGLWNVFRYSRAASLTQAKRLPDVRQILLLEEAQQ